jgi:predicted glycosyltransferase
MYAEVKQTVEDFRKIVREITPSVIYFKEEISTCDKAFSDIRHYVETNKPDRKMQRKITQLIKQYSDRRRIAKDNLLVLSPLEAFVSKQRIWNELNTVSGEMKRQITYIEKERHYNPRVIKDLFDQGSGTIANNEAKAMAMHGVLHHDGNG